MRKVRIPLMVLLVGLLILVPSMSMAAAGLVSSGATFAGVSLVPLVVTAGVVLATTIIVVSETGEAEEVPVHHAVHH